MATPLGIIGASGYAGIEATRILAHHPRAELRLLASDRWGGDPVEKRIGNAGAVGKLRYAPLPRAVELAREARCEAVLLATPADASLSLAPALLEAGVRLVIDLSGAYRLRDPAAFHASYGLAHTSLSLLAEAVYGLPELLPDAPRTLRAARLVSFSMRNSRSMSHEAATSSFIWPPIRASRPHWKIRARTFVPT